MPFKFCFTNIKSSVVNILDCSLKIKETARQLKEYATNSTGPFSSSWRSSCHTCATNFVYGYLPLPIGKFGVVFCFLFAGSPASRLSAVFSRFNGLSFTSRAFGSRFLSAVRPTSLPKHLPLVPSERSTAVFVGLARLISDPDRGIEWVKIVL